MIRQSLLLLLAGLALSEGLLSRPDLRFHFDQFKQKFGKVYRDELEELKRLDIFVENVNKISKHNMEADLGIHTFTLGLNQFTDMENMEFARMMNGYKGRKALAGNSTYSSSGMTLPDSVDWRTNNLVTPIKNQGQCGSCWAFSAVASLEGQHSKATKKLVSLSEQNLVDCSGKEGNEGCNGGLMDQAFQYVKDVGGLDTEQSYPYDAKDEKCKFNKQSVGATLKGWTDIKASDESDLTDAIANVGPVSVAIDASSFFFQFYRSGVLWDPLCSSKNLDHGVTAVGFGADSNGKKYYIVKNSWGTTWGDQGYVLMPRDSNNKCGIASQASYPLV